jgi:hypothetical protein
LKAEAFLSHCDKVRKTGPDSWIACCPAHGDKNPSMTVRELDDGRVLLHCFGGCSVEEILRSVNLDFDALFPDRLPSGKEYSKGLRRPFPASDVIEALAEESMIVAVAAYRLGNGLPVLDCEQERLRVAFDRIALARRLALGIR